ncbi:effector-associated constant component EACC1 [Streptomyces acidiscabies]|uniref:effector-associated constant component EACC1 n=1 Tax=Streptomyces acidiscabies TaxID=42234 RepID=UPI0038F758DB
MAEGEAPTSGWRVRYDGSRGDVDALKAWLEREESLSGLVRAGELRIVAKARAGDGPEYMGSQTDLMLLVIGTVANLTTIGASLAASARAWRENRERVTGEPTPEPTVEELDPDQE